MNCELIKGFRLRNGDVAISYNDGIDLHKLQTELLNLNPHHPCESEYDWFKLWILRNIEDYKAGDYYVLSLTSSGSILNCGDDED